MGKRLGGTVKRSLITLVVVVLGMAVLSACGSAAPSPGASAAAAVAAATPVAATLAAKPAMKKIASLTRTSTAKYQQDFESPLFTVKTNATRLGWNVTPVAGQYNWRIAVYREGQKVDAAGLLGNVLFLLSNATYGSGLADSGAKDYKLKPGKYRLLVELWHCSATVTVSQGGKQSVAAKPTPAAKPQIPKNQEEALGYIRACGAQAAKVRQEVRAVQGAIYLAAKSPTQANRRQLETVGNWASNAIYKAQADFGPQKFPTSGMPQALWNAAYAMSQGANDMSNALSTLATYAAGMSATPANFGSQFKKARSEWNEGVRVIWRTAGKTKPPVI